MVDTKLQNAKSSPAISNQYNPMSQISKIHRDNIKDIAPLICRNNQLEPNPILVHTIPYQLTFDEIAGSNVVLIGANSSVTRAMTNDKAGPIMSKLFLGVATSNEILINIQDSQYHQYLMNNPIHWNTFIGSGAFPFETPDYLFVVRCQTLQYELTDLSGFPNTARIVNDGFRLYFDAEESLFNNLSQANQISRLFFYTTDIPVTLAVSPNPQTYYITVLNVADFYWNKTTFYSDGDFLVKMTNLSTGYSFSNGFIHSSCLGGNAQNNKDFESMLVRRRSQLKVEFINLLGVPNRVFLTLTGLNYYYEG